MKLQTKLAMVGVVLLAVFNPLAVNLWADALIVALNWAAKELVNISGYTMAVGATLLLVSVLLWHNERGKKENAKLKKLKHKKTKSAGKYIDS